jgi:hypothetical protein
MIGWSQCGSHEKAHRACHAELLFLHPGGYAGHVVHSGAPEVRIFDSLFFKLEWAQCRSIKKHIMTHHADLVFFASGAIGGSRSAFWCIRGMKCRRTIFHARVDLVRIPQKACQNTLRQTCVFASGWISRSHSSFRCVRARNIDALFFMLG